MQLLILGISTTNLRICRERISQPHCDCNSSKHMYLFIFTFAHSLKRVSSLGTSFLSVNCCGNLQLVGRINNKANYEPLPDRSILDDSLASGDTLRLPPRLSSSLQLFPSVYTIATIHQNVEPTTSANSPGCVLVSTTRGISLSQPPDRRSPEAPSAWRN